MAVDETSELLGKMFTLSPVWIAYTLSFRSNTVAWTLKILKIYELKDRSSWGNL